MITWTKLKSLHLRPLLSRERAASAEKMLLSAQARHIFEFGKLVLDETNPFVSASRLMLQQGEKGIPSATQYLTSFFMEQRGKNVTQYLDIPEDSVRESRNVPSKYWSTPLEASLSPWDGHTLIDENIPDQLSPSRASDDVERLWGLIQSIQLRGYQRHPGPDGDITCEALVSQEGALRFQLISGTHRGAVLVAMSKSRFPIRVVRFVTNERPEDWPKVQSGDFSIGGAMKRFDKFFSQGTEL